MTRLLRNPLSYLVAGEVCVLLALAVAAWHLIPHPVPQAALAPPAPVADSTPPVESPPAIPTPAPRGTPAAPAAQAGSATGSATSDPAFWTARLTDLNREQAALQRAQWNLIDTALGAARRYLEAVVVPAVEQASRDHRPRTQRLSAVT